MIELLGVKRAILLLVLLALNAVVAAVFLLVLEPMRTDADNHLNAVRGEISTLQANIENVKAELASFNENLPKYEALKVSGFFSPQDRFEIGRYLEDLKTRSGISGFSYKIADIQRIANTDADTAKLRLISSRIELDSVMTLLDTGFYNLLTVLPQSFPQQVRIESFSVKRTGKIDDALLENVRQGKASPLVAQVAFDFMTVTDLPPQTEAGTGAP
jgi:uncharacterized protein (DUF2236 family)